MSRLVIYGIDFASGTCREDSYHEEDQAFTQDSDWAERMFEREARPQVCASYNHYVLL